MARSYRDYVQPKIPSEWKGAERTYAVMLQNVLDDLHMPIKEEYLSNALIEKLQTSNTAQSVAGYFASEGLGSALTTRIRSSLNLDTLLNGKLNRLDYSTVSQNTGTGWVNGSGIKCRTLPTIIDTADVATYTDSISNLSNIVKIEGGVRTNNGDWYPFGYTDIANSLSVNVHRAYTDDYLTIVSSFTGVAYLIVYYT